MNVKLLNITLVTSILLWSNIAGAHHSHSNLNRNDIRTYQGIVTKYGWAMPHVYLKVKGPDSTGKIVEYSVEMGNPPGMVRKGWNKNTLKPGDRVTWEGPHDHNEARHYTGMNWIEKADGTRIGYESETMGAEQEAIPSTDFTGLWSRSDPGGFNPHYNPPEGWPLSKTGQKLVDNFHEDQNPMRSCGNPGPPKAMIVPYPVMFTRPDDKTLIMERELMEEVRVIHFDKNHPRGEPSKLGHSIGWFEGDELVIETDNFIADKWGIHTGIDSSAQKHLIERFSLSDDGLILNAEITVTDPVYLSESKVFTHRWKKLADRDIIQAPCTMEAAQLYLEGGLE